MYIIILRGLGVNEAVFQSLAVSYAGVTVGSLFINFARHNVRLLLLFLYLVLFNANIHEQKTLPHLGGRIVEVKYTRKITTPNCFSQERGEKRNMYTKVP